MRIKLSILFVLLSFAVFGQRTGFFLSTAKGVAPQPAYITAIDYDVDLIQRQGESFQIHIDNTVPAGQSKYKWVIVNSSNEFRLDSATTRNPTFTLDTIGRYDIWATVMNADTLTRHQRGRITVLPALPADPEGDADYVWDLDAITSAAGSPFANSANATVTNGSATVTTSANHGVGVNDWVQLAVHGGFYQAQTGTTGTTLVLDRPYEGATGTVLNSVTRDFGVGTNNGCPCSNTLDGDVIDTGSYPTSDLLDRLGNDTGADVRIRRGYKIAIKGETPCYLQVQNWVGTHDQPVHFYNVGQVKIYANNGAQPYAMQWFGKMQNIVFDGRGEDGNDYGIQLHASPTRPGQIFFLNGRWNSGLICTGVEVPYTGTDAAAAFSYDPVFTTHANTVATGTSGASTLTLTNTIATIPAAGRLVIHTGGSDFATGTSHFYDYSSYNAGTKTFTLTSTLSQTYSPGTDVDVNICSDHNWSANGVWYVGNRVSDENGGNDESFYIGFNNDATQTTGFRPYQLDTVAIYYNYIAGSGRDGIQPGGCKLLEIHNNTILRSGLKGDFSHTSGLSYNDGNQGWVFRNTFKGSQELSVVQTGRTGGDSYFAYNDWSVSTPEGTDIGSNPAESFFIAIETGGPATIDYHFFGNTIDTQRRTDGVATIPFTIQHNDASNVQSLNFTVANNLILKASGSQANYAEVKVNTSPAGGRSGWLIDNRVKDIGDEDDFFFVHYDTMNYHLQKASPAYGDGVDLTSRLDLPNWLLNYDIDGYPITVQRETVTDITSGSHSGYENWVEPDDIAPTISTFTVTNGAKDRITFTISEPITASTFAGFTLTGTTATITGINIGSGTGYFQLSENIDLGASVTIAYDGSDDWKDVSAAENAMAAFSATAVDNQIELVNYRVLLDVGASFLTSAVDDLGRKWNNTATFDVGDVISTVDTDNIPSPLEFEILANLNGVTIGTMGASGFNGSSTGYPATVWRDYTSGGGAVVAQIRINNAESTHTYNIKVSGSRATGNPSDQTRRIEVRAQGGSWVEVNCNDNTTLFATINGVVPDGSDQILIEVRPSQVGTTSSFAYIGVIDVEAVLVE